MKMQKTPNLSRSRVLTLASWALIEILRRILGRDHTHFKHYVIAARANPSDRPPLKEGPNPYTIKLCHFTLDNLSGDLLRVGGDVVIRRERDLARTAKLDEKIAGGLVDSII